MVQLGAGEHVPPGKFLKILVAKSLSLLFSPRKQLISSSEWPVIMHKNHNLMAVKELSNMGKEGIS